MVGAGRSGRLYIQERAHNRTSLDSCRDIRFRLLCSLLLSRRSRSDLLVLLSLFWLDWMMVTGHVMATV